MTVTVSDGTASAAQTFTWTVTNVNRAPVLTALADRTDAENATVSLPVVASDPDSDTLTFSATGLPNGPGDQRDDGDDHRHADLHERRHAPGDRDGRRRRR